MIKTCVCHLKFGKHADPDDVVAVAESLESAGYEVSSRLYEGGILIKESDGGNDENATECSECGESHDDGACWDGDEKTGMKECGCMWNQICSQCDGS